MVTKINLSLPSKKLIPTKIINYISINHQRHKHTPLQERVDEFTLVFIILFYRLPGKTIEAKIVTLSKKLLEKIIDFCFLEICPNLLPLVEKNLFRLKSKYAQ